MDAIDTSVNGRGAFISRLVPAWHGLGEIRPEWSMPQILATPGLAYRVGLETVHTESGKEIPGQFATVRSDTGAPLSIVGNRYEVIQHTEEWAEFDGVLMPAGYVYETAGVLNGGRDTFLLAKRPEGIMVLDGDETRPFILFRFSYDGRSSVTCKFVAERVVCANTLAIALGERGARFAVSIRHTASASDRLAQVRATLQNAAQAFARFEVEARQLVSWEADKATTKGTLGIVLEAAHGRAPEEDAALKRYRETCEETLSAIGAALQSPRQNLPGMAGTRWQLFNAISEWADHQFAKGVKGSPRARAERQFLSAIDGHAQDVKALAWQALNPFGVGVAA